MPTIVNIQLPGNYPTVRRRTMMSGTTPAPAPAIQRDNCLLTSPGESSRPLGEGFSDLLQGLEQNFNGGDSLMQLLELMGSLLGLLSGPSPLSVGNPANSAGGPSPLSPFGDDFLGRGRDKTQGNTTASPSPSPSHHPAIAPGRNVSSARSPHGVSGGTSSSGAPSRETPSGESVAPDTTYPSPPSEKSAGSNLRSQNAAQPVDPPLTGTQGNRSAETYDAVIDQFDVADNPRYAHRDSNGDGVSDTFCNIFVSDVTRAMGAEIPHWWKGRELNANATCDWLQNEGAQYGWKKVGEQEAQDLANQGKPVVVTWKNGGGIGHVGVVRPGENSNGPALAQAGATNVNKAHVRDSSTFGGVDAVYYAHP